MKEHRLGGAAVAIAVAALLACGEPDWREARAPVLATSYGGSIEPDIAIRDDQPMRTIYEPAPDLTLGLDSVAAFGTPADSVNPPALADTTPGRGGGREAVRDTLAVEGTRADTLLPSVGDTAPRVDTTGAPVPDTARDTLRPRSRETVSAVLRPRVPQ